MHWSLTTFERKRIEKIALDHPFFDMHAPLLTKKEIRGILSQRPRKTGPQVIADIKKELGLNDAPVTQKKRTFTDALHDAFFVPSFCRTVVLASLALLLILFMTFTTPGRTLAEEVYSIVVNFIDGHLKANSFSSSEHDWDFLSLPEDLNSPKALAGELGCPIAVTSDKLTSFRYISIDKKSLLIRSKYLDVNNKQYVLEQGIYSGDTHWGYVADINNGSTQICSGIGIEMFGGISADEANLLTGFTTYEIYQIASKQLTLPELVLIAEKLYYVS